MIAKKVFEKHLAHKISDRTWYRVKAIMADHNLPINKDNLMVVATLKRESTRHRMPLNITLSYYLKVANIETRIKGDQLYNYLQLLTSYRPHRTTIIRWFEGDFDPNKLYRQSELSKVLLSAFLYNLRNKNHVVKQKSDRISQISGQKIK
jgi:hypothetical protein